MNDFTIIFWKNMVLVDYIGIFLHVAILLTTCCRWCKLILFQKTFNLYNYESLASCYKISNDFLFMNIPVFENNLILNCSGKLSRAKHYCKKIDFRPLKGLIRVIALTFRPLKGLIRVIALTFKLIRDIYHGRIIQTEDQLSQNCI